jgi:hypothetical protein
MSISERGRRVKVATPEVEITKNKNSWTRL